jgi:tetratricopeptide (TPR) repeat protein
LVGREVVSNLQVNRAAAAYRSSGDVAAAGSALQSAIQISPRNDRAHRAAAELGLVEFSQLAAQGEPQTAEARTQLQNTLQTTIRHGLTAVEIDEKNYQNWLLLAQVYGSLAGVNIEGAFEEAKRTYERAFEANPTNPVPKLRLAQLSASRGDIAAARTYLDEAIALKQDFAAAYFLRSQVEAASGNLQAGAEAAAAAVQLVPTDPLGWFNLGQILYASGNYADAAAVLEQAVARANDYSNALFYLSASYYKLGRTAEAIMALERVAELNPGETSVRDMLTTLRTGGDPFAL